MTGLSRRGLMLTTVSAAAGSLLAATPAEAGNGRPTTFVLVHGANGSSAVWAGLAGELAARGHFVYAADLPGHGAEGWFPQSYQAPQDIATFANLPSPIGGLTPPDNVAHVTTIVRRLAVRGPVVLVGQSLGGITITGVADAVPHLVQRLVYISAFCCTLKASIFEYLLTPQGSTSVVGDIPALGDPAATGAQRNNWRSADPAFLAAAKAAFLADGTDDQVRTLLNLCQPDEAIHMYFDNVSPHAERWGIVPRSFIRLTADRSIPLALQNLMIQDADAFAPHHKFQVDTLPYAHLGWIFEPAELAALLVR